MTHRNWLFSALAISTLVKLFLALFTHGTSDVDGFADHLVKVREFGVGAYHYRGVFDNPFNSPPPMIHAIKALGFIAEKTGIPFGFWLRLLPILAGVGSFLLVRRLLNDRKESFWVLLALALCPISIMVDGYHGNTDSVVIMFVLLSIYLIDRPVLSGLAFGLACCVKVVPLMFVPIFVLYLPHLNARVKFAATATGVFMVLSLPYAVQDPMVVKRVVFGYSSIYGSWGIPQLLAIFFTVKYAHQPFEPLGAHGLIAAGLKYLTLALVCLSSWMMNRRKIRPSLYQQCGVIITIVLFLAPGFGPQYLVWLVPFVPVLGLRPTLAYYAIAGLYLGFKYLGFPDLSWAWPFGLGLSIGCWLSMYFLFRIYFTNEHGRTADAR